MRLTATIALSASLLLGPGALGLFAQDAKTVEKTEAPKDTPKDNPPKEAAKEQAKPATKEYKAGETPAVAKPADAAKPDAAKPAEGAAAAPAKPVEKTIPPEVQVKLDAARKAVAEAIAAAEAAGLIETSVEPPPILDILVMGQVNDVAALKAVTKDAPEAGVSPEVFGAWFTGFAKPMENVKPEANVRIFPPSRGLSDFYSRRATIFAPLLVEARKANPPKPPGDDAKKAEEAKKAEQMKKDEDAKKAEEAKKAEDAKKAEEAKKADDAKPKDAPKTEEKKDAPKDEPKPAEAPKDQPADKPADPPKA